ncbi:MAG: hypothetical protein E7161_02260 [Firmicutes bacterium]|nr:hypothetical protein [Bacillota bacterium]
MLGKDQLEIYKKQIKNNPQLEEVLSFCNFEFRDNIDVKEDILICGEESNYEIYPFGKDGCGCTYALLNNQYVGFISSAGGCGIIANNIKDFFNFLAVIKNIESYFVKGVFDNLENFNDTFKMASEDFLDSITRFGNYSYDVSIQALEKFIIDNGFVTDNAIMYEKLKSALITEPSFVLRADPSEYEPWDDVFYTNQKYINELREKKVNHD